jgi:preprotein translocase subunit SecE
LKVVFFFPLFPREDILKVVRQTSFSLKSQCEAEKVAFWPMRRGLSEEFVVVFSFAVVVTEMELIVRHALAALYSGFPPCFRMRLVACQQHVGWHPAWRSAWNKVLKSSWMVLYAILVHSNPIQSGPSALVVDEDLMAFWISSVVTFSNRSG